MMLMGADACPTQPVTVGDNVSLSARLKSRIVVADKENRERQVFKKRCGSSFFENLFERFDAVPGGETTF